METGTENSHRSGLLIEASGTSVRGLNKTQAIQFKYANAKGRIPIDLIIDKTAINFSSKVKYLGGFPYINAKLKCKHTYTEARKQITASRPYYRSAFEIK